jgi:hypothetical protein
MATEWLKAKYRQGRQYKGVSKKGGGQSDKRKSNWLGKNAPKNAGFGDGKKAAK